MRCMKVIPVSKHFIFLDNVVTAQLAESLNTSQRGRSGFPGRVKSDTVSPMARHFCDISPELCYFGDN